MQQMNRPTLLGKLVIIAMASSLLLMAASPFILGQTNEAAVKFELKENTIILTIQSPVPVAQFQVAINTSSTYALSPSTATLTGFFEGATQLSNLNQGGINEHRWFNLNAKAGQTGALSLSAPPFKEGTKLILTKVSLRDASGNAIPVAGILPRDAVIVTTTTTAVTTTITALSTVTVTSTAAPRTVTTTQTTTTTSPVTVTSTATTTVTSTTTVTTTAPPTEGVSQTSLIIIAVLVIIILALLVLMMRRRR
jgi:hypothetical protein